ncbi:FAD/NAD(P)-binding protein [Acetobacter orientalis]|uniref:FAD/NAD(P)-binding protein n=1 Tax=Acetobacter orientalis TaxID=146474 RepID=UPI0039EAA285
MTTQRSNIVAIIGGGFSGAALAWHLLKKPTVPLSVLIFEPRALLGSGVAYSAEDPNHRINVPASRMSIDTKHPLDFLEWLAATGASREDKGAHRPDGQIYPARKVFGHYVATKLAPLLEAHLLTHIPCLVADVQKLPTGRWILTTSGGKIFEADTLVIATSHPAPQLPKQLISFEVPLSAKTHPILIDDPWKSDALTSIKPEDRVLIIGTGLSMADTVASLVANKHNAPILAISRRGQRSKGHSQTPVTATGDFLSPPAVSAKELLQRIRQIIADNPDTPWQAFLDRVREQAPQIWEHLGQTERRRLIRHLRPFWDTHRFRISPPTENIVNTAIQKGILRIKAARILTVEKEGKTFQVTLRTRCGQIENQIVDVIISTTGPAHINILSSQPFLKSLVKKGHIEMDSSALGLHVSADGNAQVGSQKDISLFVAGPLARGRFGELMGLPEVTLYAEKLACTIRAQAAITAPDNTIIAP